jgi:hypothetical protein
MLRYSLFIFLGACLMLLVVPGFAAADDKVCIYKDDNFHGHEQCFRTGESVSDLKNADIESIRVHGNAKAILYEERNFGGRMMEFTTDIPKLKRVPQSGSRSWHEHVGSMRVVSDDAYDRERRYERDREY